MTQWLSQNWRFCKISSSEDKLLISRYIWCNYCYKRISKFSCLEHSSSNKRTCSQLSTKAAREVPFPPFFPRPILCGFLPFTLLLWYCLTTTALLHNLPKHRKCHRLSSHLEDQRLLVPSYWSLSFLNERQLEYIPNLQVCLFLMCYVSEDK